MIFSIIRAIEVFPLSLTGRFPVPKSWRLITRSKRKSREDPFASLNPSHFLFSGFASVRSAPDFIRTTSGPRQDDHKLIEMLLIELASEGVVLTPSSLVTNTISGAVAVANTKKGDLWCGCDQGLPLPSTRKRSVDGTVADRFPFRLTLLQSHSRLDSIVRWLNQMKTTLSEVPLPAYELESLGCPPDQLSGSLDDTISPGL